MAKEDFRAEEVAEIARAAAQAALAKAKEALVKAVIRRLARGEWPGYLRGTAGAYHLFEGVGVGYSHIGQEFAVQTNAGFPQVTHKLAVGKTLRPDSSIDAGNPELSHIALALTAVVVGVA